MQDYQIEAEDKFSDEQIKNSERIVFMACVQIVIVIIIGLIQAFALKRVFKYKSWLFKNKD